MYRAQSLYTDGQKTAKCNDVAEYMIFSSRPEICQVQISINFGLNIVLPGHS